MGGIMKTYLPPSLRFPTMNDSLSRTPKLVPLILLSSLCVKMVISRILQVHGDEGMYLYDASLILNGMKPHIDFHARSPVFLLCLSGWMYLFGSSVFVGRLFSSIVSTITGYLVYRIGRSLYNERVGIISLILFSFSPFTVRWSVIIATEVLQVTFICLSFYFLLNYLKEERPHAWFLVPGIIIGLTIFIRRTSLVIVLVQLLLIMLYGWYHTGQPSLSFRSRILRIGIVRSCILLAGSFLSFLPIFIYLMVGKDFTYAVQSFMSSAGVGGTGKGDKIHLMQILTRRMFYLIIPVWIFLVQSLQSHLKRIKMDKNVANIPFFPLLGIAILPLMLVQSVLVLVLILLFLFALYFHHTYGSFPGPCSSAPGVPGSVWDTLIMIFCAISVLAVLYSASPSAGDIQFVFAIFLLAAIATFVRSATSWGENHPSIIDLCFLMIIPVTLIFFSHSKLLVIDAIIVITILLLFGLHLKAYESFSSDDSFSNTFLLLWLLGPLVFYLYYNMSQEIFIYELSAIMCLIGGVVYSRVNGFKGERTVVTKAIVIAIVLSMLTAPFFYLEYERSTTITKPWTVELVASYIKEHTEEGEEIFTANMAIAIEADRPIVMHLSHPTIYCDDYVQGFPDFSVIDYPTPEEIIQYLDTNRIRYIVNDPLTNYYYFMFNPELRTYVMKNYIQVREINHVRILVRSAEGEYRLTSNLQESGHAFLEQGLDGSITAGYRYGPRNCENIHLRELSQDMATSPEIQISPMSFSSSRFPHSATDSMGNRYVVWSEHFITYSAIMFATLDRDNGVLVQPTLITEYTQENTFAETPRIMVDSSGHVFIFWSWASTPNGPFDLFYTVLHANGTRIGDHHVRLTNTMGNDLHPSVVMDENDLIHLVWMDGSTGTYTVNYATFAFNTTSQRLFPMVEAKTISHGTSLFPDIAVTSSAVHVVWEHEATENETTLKTIRYLQMDPQGKITRPERPITYRYISDLHRKNRMETDVGRPRVSADEGKVVVVWQDNRWEEQSDRIFWFMDRKREDFDNRYWNIYLKVLDSKGEIISDDMRISYLRSNSMEPDVIMVDAHAHVIWVDDITGSMQVLHKRIFI